MRWLTLAVLCGSFGCAGLKSSSISPPPTVTKLVGTTEVVVADGRAEIPDPDRRATRINGEQPLPMTKLDAAIRNVLEGITPPAQRIDVTIESFTLQVVEPGKVGSRYAPLVDPSQPGSISNPPQDPLGMAILLILWPFAELANLGYHAGKEATKSDQTPGAACCIRATITVTKADGTRTSTVITGKGGDDNVYGEFWGDALRGATDRALTQFGEQLKTAISHKPDVALVPRLRLGTHSSEAPPRIESTATSEAAPR